MTKTEAVIYCDFCGESQFKASHIVAGPKDIHICNKCIALSAEIVAQANERAKPKEDA